MKCRDRVLLLAVVIVVGSSIAFAQQTSANFPPQAQEPHPPEHPVSEEQLRTYFKVCHIESISLQLTHEKMEQRRKQLPEWYPQLVWDEIEQAVDNIDLPQVALPIYQKYLSEEDAGWLIKFSATPQMQKLIRSILEKDRALQYEGVDPNQARNQAVARVAEEQENAELGRLATLMTPADERELKLRVTHLEQMQPLLAQLRSEYNQALKDKQTELAKAITSKHAGELSQAKRKFEAEHPPDSQPHQ